jgi:uncharacterized protein (TIGR02722 family)
MSIKPPISLTVAVLALGLGASCVRAERGGPDNPELDEKAMSTGLDRVDVDFMADAMMEALTQSQWWATSIQGSGSPPVLAIWPIKNATTQHIDDQMLQMLSRMETTLINSGSVQVVTRERQPEMSAEVWVQHGQSFDQTTAAAVAKQVGAKYYVTGKVTASDERLKRQRRVQYSLFLQVVDVETSLIKFQQTVDRTKAVKG